MGHSERGVGGLVTETGSAGPGDESATCSWAGNGEGQPCTQAKGRGGRPLGIPWTTPGPPPESWRRACQTPGCICHHDHSDRQAKINSSGGIHTAAHSFTQPHTRHAEPHSHTARPIQTQQHTAPHGVVTTAAQSYTPPHRATNGHTHNRIQLPTTTDSYTRPRCDTQSTVNKVFQESLKTGVLGQQNP